MYHKLALLILTLVLFISLQAQESTSSPVYYSIEPVIHIGQIVRNAPDVPKSNLSVISELNLSIQTSGKHEWNSLFWFPKAGCSFFYGNLGNNKELGNFFGLLPNMTFNTLHPKWYLPRINIGLGIAWFNNPYNPQTNTTNYYIGSAITALGFASLYVQPRINNYFSIKTGISVIHCSNGHVQIPNLGMNLPTVFAGVIFTPKPVPSGFARYKMVLPPSSVHFGLRLGTGVHQLAAKATEPIGTPKFIVYTADLYLHKRLGNIHNVQVGIELKHYNSYYNYINKYNFYTQNQKMKASVAGIFIAHELLIHKVSVLSQGGINLYNPFYNDYIDQFKSQQGFKAELKKYISTRLGLQYYLHDPRYCTRSNVFIGTYIKANFGQADFICSQIGVIF